MSDQSEIKSDLLLLQKGVYPFEHMDDWEKFNEEILPPKKFYSNLNMEGISGECFQ